MKKYLIIGLALALVAGITFYFSQGASLQGKFTGSKTKGPDTTTNSENKTKDKTKVEDLFSETSSDSEDEIYVTVAQRTSSVKDVEISNNSGESTLLGEWSVDFSDDVDMGCTQTLMLSLKNSAGGSVAEKNYFSDRRLYVVEKGDAIDLSGVYASSSANQNSYISNQLPVSAGGEYDFYLYGTPITEKEFDDHQFYMTKMCVMEQSSNTEYTWNTSTPSSHFSMGSDSEGVPGGYRLDMKNPLLMSIEGSGSGTAKLDTTSMDYDLVGEWMITYDEGEPCNTFEFISDEDGGKDLGYLFSDTRLYFGESDSEIEENIRDGIYLDPDGMSMGLFTDDAGLNGGTSYIVQLYAQAYGMWDTEAQGGSVYLMATCSEDSSNGQTYYWSMPEEAGYSSNDMFEVSSANSYGVSGGKEVYSF